MYPSFVFLAQHVLETHNHSATVKSMKSGYDCFIWTKQYICLKMRWASHEVAWYWMRWCSNLPTLPTWLLQKQACCSWLKRDTGPLDVPAQRWLTGGAVQAADTVRVVQVVPVELPVQVQFGQLSWLSYAFQFCIYIISTLHDSNISIRFIFICEA